MVDHGVADQSKFYRRTAFEAIGGFLSELIRDGIDFHMARVTDYRTRSLVDPDLRIRPGLAAGRFRTVDRPPAIGRVRIVAGSLGAAIRRSSQPANPDFRMKHRKWQARRQNEVFFSGRVR